MDEPAPWRVLEAHTRPTEDAAAPAASRRSDRGGWPRWLPGVLLAAAGALAVGAFVLAATGAHPEVSVEGAGSADATRPASTGRLTASAGSMVVVDVQGAVTRPGIVRLVAGSRVADAIAAAGGYSARVASDRVPTALNLAALLRDGDQVVVPSRDDRPASSSHPVAIGGGSGGAPGGTASTSGPLDLNAATAEQLDELPGIGPVTAAKIVAARAEQAFSSVDDLRTRKLVGASTFDKLKDLVTVR